MNYATYDGRTFRTKRIERFLDDLKLTHAIRTQTGGSWNLESNPLERDPTQDSLDKSKKVGDDRGDDEFAGDEPRLEPTQRRR